VPEGRDGRRALRLNLAHRQQLVPSIEQTLPLEPGLYTVEGWIKTREVGTNDPRSGVRLCLDARPAGNWWHCTEVTRGTTDWTQARVAGIPVRERGRYKVWLGAYGAPDGTAWFDGISLTAAAKPALDVYLLYRTSAACCSRTARRPSGSRWPPPVAAAACGCRWWRRRRGRRA
jgi:hypothetical protein